MRPVRLPSLAALTILVACGGGGGGIEDYYPPLPDPTGAAQEVFAGEITQASAGELVHGPAATGMVGDLFMRNDRASFIISAPTRVIGVIPQGGNLIDAVLRDASGQIVDDHFGELGLLYKLGKTCDHDSIEVVRDGSGGGVAVIRARGLAASDDFIDFKGIGNGLSVEPDVDPDVDDGVECATTYVLEPGSTTLQVYFTLYNPTGDPVQGPMGTIADTGGETESWGDQRGFERLTLSLAALSMTAPLNYTVFQGPGVGYGIVPRAPAPTVSSAFLIGGVSVFLFGTDELLAITQRDKDYLHLPAKKGFLQQVDVVVGRDGEDIDGQYRTGKGETLTAVGGTVAWSTGGAPAGARVGVYSDANGNGQIDDADPIISYMDPAADGTFAGQVPAGNLLLRAEVKNQGRSAAMPAGGQVALTIPVPVRLDFDIVDDQTNMPIPGRLLVIGDDATALPDRRVFETYDRLPNVISQIHSIRGTSTVGADADPPIMLPSGGTYRIYATRGTEWSSASQPFSGTVDGAITLRLRQVAPATGYLSTEWHVHQVGSPDSPVGSDERLRSAASAGIEMFAVTDHDYVSDLEPLAVQLGIDDLVRVVPGIEVTPFAYGHFNAWPLQPDDTSPNKGAIDWARGMAGFAMTPGEIFAAMRARGAQMIQINHARNPTAFGQLMAFFDRAQLTFDYTNRTIYGDFANEPIPADFLRLPGVSLWDDTFNSLEVWNAAPCSGSKVLDACTRDKDLDGIGEDWYRDLTMRDWFNMLSLGKVVTGAGDSDTHTSMIDPMGMPRTYVRVPDDSAAALQSGASVDAALATMSGTAPRDIVVTNGPMLAVTAAGAPAIGQTLTPPGGTLTLQVTVTSPQWAEIDTIEVFANTTPDPVNASQDATAITPLKCWTSRPLASLMASDPCMLAHLAPEAATIQLVTLGGPGAFKRYEATVTITLTAADILDRAGATGTDAWLVIRARGDRSIFPIMPQRATDDPTLPVVLTGDMTQIASALQHKGVGASGFTAPIFVDFDGGGYRAPFAP